MNTKNLWVSFLAIATVLLLASVVSAGPITSSYTVEVNGQDAYANTVSVVENEKVTVEVAFTSLVNDSDVTVEIELTGNKGDVDAETAYFDVEAGVRYTKTVVIEVPTGLNDEVSDSLKLDMKISGKDHESELNDVALRVQRESYSIQIKSVSVGTMKAGSVVPVDIVVKNVGYNDLDDMYVMVKIPA